MRHHHHHQLLIAAVLLLLGACNEFDLTVQKEPEKPLNAPEAVITSPADGMVLAETFNYPLTGAVSDVEDLDVTLLTSWTSDLDGVLAEPTPGEGGDVSLGEQDLTPGVHTLTLDVVDSDGMEGSDTVEIEVCEIQGEGSLQVETDGHIWIRIIAGEANAVNELYLIEPELLLITLDANQDWGLVFDMGIYEACTQLVFRLVTSLSNQTYDSNVDHNFAIERMESNLWHVGVEDGADEDYNDILLDVYGGLAEGQEPPDVGVPPQ